MILSPKDKAIPCVLERIRIYPLSLPFESSFFSTETFTRASSPKTDFAYKFAAKNEDAPCNDDLGVRQHMLVDATICSRNSFRASIFVEIATLFSHSNSAPHMPKCLIRASCRSNIVHDIKMDVVQVNICFLGGARLVVHNRTKNMTRLGG